MHICVIWLAGGINMQQHWPCYSVSYIFTKYWQVNKNVIKVTALTSLPALFPFYFISQQWLSASKNCHTRLDWMNLGAVSGLFWVLNTFSPCVWMIYCVIIAWELSVLEPPCDSSISSLSTSHFLQCSSFSVLSIASAEVHQRNRSFIIHPMSKKLKLGLQGKGERESTMSSKV